MVIVHHCRCCTERSTVNRLLTFRWLLLIFLAALTARSVWGTIRFIRAQDPTAFEFPDEQDYWSIAESLARHGQLIGEHGFRALRMPGYPAFLSLFTTRRGGVVGAKMAQWILAALAAPLAAALAAKIGGRRAGLTAGFLVAFDPFLVFFSSLLLTESLVVTALLAVWLVGWSIQRRELPAGFGQWAAVGALAATCVLIRESTLGLCLLWTLFLVARRRFDRRGIGGAMLSGGIVLLALLPWAMRNQRVTGQWCWLTNRGGISLYDAVGPQADGASDLADIKQMDAVAGLDEAAWNRYFLDASYQCIRQDPERMVRLAFAKIRRTWNPFPNVASYQSAFVRLMSAGWTLGVYMLAVIGVIGLRRRAGDAAALLLPAGYVLMLHSLFIGSIRYRLVVMPMLEVLAAVGAVMLVTRRTVIADPGTVPPQDL